MERQQRFSLRKFKCGLASALLGTVLVFGTGQAKADEQATVRSAEASQPLVEQVTGIDTSSQEKALSADQPVAEGDKTKLSEEAVQEVAPKQADSSVTPVAEGQESSQVDVKKTEVAESNPTTSVTEPASSTDSKVNASGEAETPTTVESKLATPGAQASDNTSQTEANAEKNPVEASSKNEEQPASISSNEIIKVPQTWSQGYKGEGRVVAVIDSGLDVHHEVLRISDPSKAKYQTEAALEAAKKKAGIDYGKWYNNKVVYAYNYIDGDDSIKEKDSYEFSEKSLAVTKGENVHFTVKRIKSSIP